MSDQDLRPGDEAPPGTEGAGENLCPDCGGSGRRDDGECPDAVPPAPGRVIEGVGGA